MAIAAEVEVRVNRNLAGSLMRVVDRKLDRAAEIVRKKAIAKMTRGGSTDKAIGAAIARNNPHSAAFHPPMVQSGTLIKSVKWWEDSEWSRMIGSNVPYAGFLEFGTSKMAPRPYLRTALRDSMKEIQKIFGKKGFFEEENELRGGTTAGALVFRRKILARFAYNKGMRGSALRSYVRGNT